MTKGSVASAVALGLVSLVDFAVAEPSPTPPPAAAPQAPAAAPKPAAPQPPPAAAQKPAPSAAPAPKKGGTDKAPASPAGDSDRATDDEAPSEPAGDSGARDAEPNATSSEPAAAGATTETPSPSVAAPGLGGLPPAFPEPANDAAALKRQGEERPAVASASAAGQSVFAEDWWTHARPILELHGSFRVRAELFYKFGLGRADIPSAALWPRPPDNAYTSTSGTTGASLCTQDEAGTGSDTAASNARSGCTNNTQAGANLRFRLNPELHISDNLRVLSEIDLLDNIVLGSTPGGYVNQPSANGYSVAGRSGYVPLGFFDTTQSTPRSGVNSLRDSIQVKRAWAEYTTPVGELRFGRMPNHWGLGMLYNSGDGYDDNYQQTVDRLSFTTGLKALDLYVTFAWDYVNEGATSDRYGLSLGQPYDLAQSDDVTEYMAAILRRKSPELTRLALARGDTVFNVGFQVYYRKQQLANDASGDCATAAPIAGCSLSTPLIFSRRGASAWTPDVWLQLLHKKFRFELEAATIQGSLQNVGTDTAMNLGALTPLKIRQYGLASEIEQKLVEDKLRLGFHFGWASGDADVDSLAPTSTGIQDQHGDNTISTFRFDPSYKLDLILYRNLLSRVQGTYYFRPSIQYDFMRDGAGQKIGGGLAAIWSRASQFVQTPGHARDLGIELDANLYFQSKDGALNDDPDRMGGFFTKLEYGVLFPMAGLGYAGGEAVTLQNQQISTDTNAAQTLRWYLGVLF